MPVLSENGRKQQWLATDGHISLRSHPKSLRVVHFCTCHLFSAVNGRVPPRLQEIANLPPFNGIPGESLRILPAS